jgi:alpha-ketoglutarate-dependent taurine dioxygenase
MASLTPAPLFAFRLNAADILAKLDKLQPGLGNATREPVRSAMVKAGLIYFKDQRARFDRASAGDGTWRPLAPATLAQKRDKRILRRTGRLYASMTPGNSGARVVVHPNRVSCSIVAPNYAKYHQSGTGRMPQRKILDVPSRDAKRHIFAVINRAANKAAAAIWQQGGGGGRPSGGGGGAGTNRSAA